MLLHTVSLIFSLCLLSFDVASATSESRLPVVRPLTIGGRSNSYTHRHHLQKRQPENWDDLPKVQYVELPVDHFGNGNGTFKNRYWVYDAAYKPGGPIFIDDGGESDAAPFVTDMKSSLTVSFANATGGMVINWEHRYYGASQPTVPGASILNLENLAEYYKYLTVEQALEDFVTFAKNFTYKGEDVSPGNVPWIFVGGSYPGARAAWLRQRNPEIVFISFAGSAVVKVSEQLPQYQLAIFNYFDSHGRKGCMDDLRGFIVWISKVVQNKDQRGYESFMNIIWRSKNSDIYNNFFAPSPNDGLTYWDHATKALEPIIDYVFGDFQDGDHHTTNNFCDDLQGRAANSITSSKQQKVLVNNGLIEALGLDHAQQIMGEAFHDLLTDLLANPPSGDNGTPNREANYEEDTPGKHDEVISGQNSSNDPANSNECANGDQSACQKLITDNQGWLYQTCSELGYFFTKDNKPDQLTFRNVTYSIKDCVSSFGSSVSKGPSLAPLQKYGDNKQLNPSNTFWVDGQYDPWRSATVNALDSGRYPSNVIPESGKTLQGNNFFGAVINNTYHVPLQSCSAVVLAGEKVLDGANPDCEPGAAHVQQLFLDALEKWLPKFEKHSLAIAKTSATPDRKAVNGVTSDASSLTDAVRFPAGMLLLLAVAFVLL